MTTVDAVVIGAGHQGLTAAVHLARAGWDVTVFEREPEVGGATRSGEITEEGLEHDLYATNLNLFRGSRAFADLEDDLERHGFTTVQSRMPYANVYPDGTSLRVYSDAERTTRLLREHSRRDAEGWQTLRGVYDDLARHLLPMYAHPLPSLAAARIVVRAVRRLGLRRVLDIAQLIASSTRELGDRWFDTREAKALIACWGMHLDFGPDVSFGAMFPLVETFADMDAGISLARGGISALPRALAGLVEEAGGRVVTGAAVVQVTRERGRASGVVLADGTRVAARRAVIANTTPTQLFGALLPGGGPPATRAGGRWTRFRYGPGSMMIHLSLEAPVPWIAHEDLRDFAYVHVAPYVDDLARSYQQSLAGLLPDRPMMVVGQTSRVDPSRTPDHREVLWIQVRSVPSTIAGDSLGEIRELRWESAKEAMADRVLRDLEGYAPGLSSLVRERAVLSPDDLEARNPNLVGGDPLAGSHHVSQNFLFRPWPGASTYRTDVVGLHLVGASTWPGGGVNATSGYLLAEQLRRRGGGSRRHRRRPS